MTPSSIFGRRRKQRPPQGLPVHAEHTAGPPSHLLVPRKDLDRMWSAHAERGRRRLPDELGWAAPLLDPAHPVAVLCAADQARAVIRWHHHLPTDAQVTFTCRRLGDRRRGPRPSGAGAGTARQDARSPRRPAHPFSPLRRETSLT